MLKRLKRLFIRYTIRFEEKEVELHKIPNEYLRQIADWLENAMIIYYNTKKYTEAETVKELLFDILQILDEKSLDNA